MKPSRHSAYRRRKMFQRNISNALSIAARQLTAPVRVRDQQSLRENKAVIVNEQYNAALRVENADRLQNVELMDVVLQPNDNSNIIAGQVTGEGRDEFHPYLQDEPLIQLLRESGMVVEADETASNSGNFHDGIDSELNVDDFNSKSEPAVQKKLKTTLRDDLAKVYVKRKVNHVTIKDINAVLIKHGLKVPRSGRAHVKTPRTTRYANRKRNMVHFGLEKGILSRINAGMKDCDDSLDDEIRKLELEFSIDGVPIDNSTTKTFWVISGRVRNCKDDAPFLVTVFEGLSKPKSARKFLKPFIEEVLSLEETGIVSNSVTWSINIVCFICDAPARSFVKGIVGHSGYWGCERCTQKGTAIGSLVTFPRILMPQYTLRSDKSFREKRNVKHHRYNSPLLKIIGLDMVFGFPLDPMHLVYLGVTKRYLKMLLKNKGTNKLKKWERLALDEAMLRLIDQFPSEFHRKRRNFDQVSRWKAVEYRSFLLYAGPIVLKDILNEEQFEHFLYFHAAIRLLCLKDLTPELFSFADQSLKYFVERFGMLYGKKHYVYNVHSLTHLVNDCKIYGPLETFGAFPFESLLGHLKTLLRSGNKPLAQLYKRMSEYEALNVRPFDDWVKKDFDWSQIKPQIDKDSYCLLEANLIVKVVSITTTHVYGKVFENLSDFYMEPINSRSIGIYQSSGLSKDVSSWPKNSLNGVKKCMVVNRDQDFIIMTLLH